MGSNYFFRVEAVSSIHELGIENLLKQCANCPLYNWPQLESVEGNKRCGRCKILRYCSEACQKEHWLKVHKFHCKYLSGSKEKEESLHNPKSCKFCQNEIKVGRKKMAKKEVSVLGCPFRKDVICGLPFIYGYDLMAPSPVKMGEISGVFPSKVEHTLACMNRVKHKMSKVITYNLDGVPQILHEIDEVLYDSRMIVRALYCLRSPKELDSLPYCVPMGKLVILVNSIREIFSKGGSINRDESKLIDTFVLLCHLLFIVIFRTTSVPKSFASGAYVNVTEAEITDKWEKVLQTLDSDDWTYNQLISILLPIDKSSHRCFGCDIAVDTGHVSFYETRFEDLSCRDWEEKSTFYYTVAFPIGFFLCRSSIKSPCYRKFGFLGNEYLDSVRSEEEKNNVSYLYWCDNCFKTTVDIHRCSKCLTKLYCGIACRDEDWPIHNLVCVKEKRKRKDGKLGRMAAVIEKDNEKRDYSLSTHCSKLGI